MSGQRANSGDPNRFDGKPLAQLQGQRATHWLEQLHPDAGDELHLAARAHHLRRWEVERSSYPEGRSGYLKWRKANKAHQADSAAEILLAAQWDQSAVERVKELLLRVGLKSDPEIQALEDVACLVFVETQFDPMTERLDHDHMVNVVAKTLKKMSPEGVVMASQVPLSAASQTVLSNAVATLQSDE